MSKCVEYYGYNKLFMKVTKYKESNGVFII